MARSPPLCRPNGRPAHPSGGYPSGRHPSGRHPQRTRLPSRTSCPMRRMCSRRSQPGLPCCESAVCAPIPSGPSSSPGRVAWPAGWRHAHYLRPRGCPRAPSERARAGARVHARLAWGRPRQCSARTACAATPLFIAIESSSETTASERATATLCGRIRATC